MTKNMEQRLQGRIDRLRRQDQKIGQWRAGLFALMMVLILIGVMDVWPGSLFFGAALSLTGFLSLLPWHRRVRRSLALFESRLQIEQAQEAIRDLKWDRLAPTRLKAPEGAPEFFTDLHVIGEKSIGRLMEQGLSQEGGERLLQFFEHQNISSDEILRRQRLVSELRDLRVLRQGFLTRVSLEEGSLQSGTITALFQESLVRTSSFWQVIPILILQVAFVVSLVRLQMGLAAGFLMPLAFLLMFENLRLRQKILATRAYAWSLQAAVSLNKLKAAVSLLERHHKTQKPELRRLLSPFSKGHAASRRLRQLDRISGALGVRQNFIVHILLHLVVPWDLLWTLWLENVRRETESDLPRWFHSLHEFEAVLGIANFAEARGDLNVPTLTERTDLVLQGENVRHPLIPQDRAIGNEVLIDQQERCLLITGSNMSGKSTFLRSVGLNTVLAKAGSPVAAKDFVFRNLPVFTSLSGGDSLQEGLSSFYAEVRRLREILQFTSEQGPCLFLIDEIFRGTNNRERLIGGRAYLQELVRRGGQGLVTSHDLELAQLEELGIGVVNFHFRETIEKETMSFSYKKARGPCPTTNALRVMELNGLPIG